MRAEGAHSGFGLRVGTLPGVGGQNPRRDPFAAADLRVAKQVAACLDFYYPGHPWDVEVSHKAGVVIVTLPGFGRHRFNVHLNTLKSDPGFRSIVKAGGELLERLNIPRRGYNGTAWHEALRSPIIGRNRRHGPPGG